MVSLMLPMVDAHTGKIVKLGDVIEDGGLRVIRVRPGLFTAEVDVVALNPDHVTQTIKAPIKWFPRMIYGLQFPTRGRTILIPT